MQSPDRATVAALGTLAAAAVLLALAAWMHASAATPAETADSAEDLGRALEAFDAQLDRAARLQAVGVTLLLGGMALLLLGSARAAATTVPWPGVTLTAATLVFAVGRWQSLGAQQFSATWDRWVGFEAAAWGLAAVGLVGAALLRRRAPAGLPDAELPADLVHPVDADERRDA